MTGGYGFLPFDFAQGRNDRGDGGDGFLVAVLLGMTEGYGFLVTVLLGMTGRTDSSLRCSSE